MATSLAPVLLRLFDDYGAILAGGSVTTYEAGTTTPLATYTDLAGAVPNTNPVILDAGGSATIRVTNGVAYKFIVKDSDGVTVHTEDNIIVGTNADAASSSFLIAMTYCGSPGAQAFMGGAEITVANTLPIDFDGSSASVQTNPGADYVVSVKKNGVTVGTVTFDTAGTPTLATTGGTSVALVFGDTLSFHAPDSGTAADFSITLVGALA